TVPSVTGQAFVFAKGTLEDAGFSWRVLGSVLGYAANLVVSQSPTAGTRVRDHGAPLITLSLKRNPAYPQAGQAEPVSPYQGSSPARSSAGGTGLTPSQPLSPPTAAPRSFGESDRRAHQSQRGRSPKCGRGRSEVRARLLPHRAARHDGHPRRGLERPHDGVH